MMTVEQIMTAGHKHSHETDESVFKPVREAVFRLASRSPPPRPERLSGIHNPWGGAAVLTNAWAFLDLCESATIVDEIASLLGPDVILWDSELHLRGADYVTFVAAGREGRYWPMTTLAGAVALISLSQPITTHFADVRELSVGTFANMDCSGPLYVIRYMPATSRFVRDPKLPANWIAMEEQVLINYPTRPLWLVRGEDRASNDFVTGFAFNAPRWAT